MSIFKFSYKQNVIEETAEPRLYFLSEKNSIVQKEKAKRFAVKKKVAGKGFKEFFGVIKNANHTFDDSIPVPDLPFLDESDSDTFKLYELGKDKILNIEGKNIPLYFSTDFLQLAPKTFAGTERTVDDIASHAQKRRNIIYDYYLGLETKFIKSLSEVHCASVAYLYQYLNDGDAWKDGMEYYGYVDGLWETGSFLTVSVDTNAWNIHTAVHELGHSVSYFLLDTFFNDWYNIAVDTSEAPPSDYGKTEVSEDFAESFAFYFCKGSSQEYLKSRCPVRYSYMKKLDEMSSNALIKNLTASNLLSQRFSKYDKVLYSN